MTPDGPMNEQTIDPLKAMADAQEEAANTGLTRFALKQGDSFLVANGLGDIEGFADGFFRDAPRLLSRFVLRIGGQRPMLLGAALSHENVVFEANLANALFRLNDGREIPQGTVYVNRTRYLWRHRMHERLAGTNYGTSALRLPLSLEIAADFRDIFEARGYHRAQRGQRDAPEIGKDFLRFGYRERGGHEKSVHVGFSQPARDVGEDGVIRFTLDIPRDATRVLYIEADNAPGAPTRARHRQHRASAHREMKSKRQRGASVHSSGPLCNDWLRRTRAGIALLTADLATGPYPYADIPWFSTGFGRDGIATALELLWLDLGLARGVLRLLAETQAETRDAFSEAQPGKILHEMRKGEMSRLGEVPFARYYGGVDGGRAGLIPQRGRWRVLPTRTAQHPPPTSAIRIPGGQTGTRPGVKALILQRTVGFREMRTGATGTPVRFSTSPRRAVRRAHVAGRTRSTTFPVCRARPLRCRPSRPIASERSAPAGSGSVSSRPEYSGEILDTHARRTRCYIPMTT